jgi:ribonuclease HI
MIEAYTDGSCLGNPGPGGWAYLINKDPKIENFGGKDITTNNVMEMTAIIKVLEKCLELGITSIRVFTDSNYVRMGLTEWSKNWERNGWKTSSGGDVKNKDEWIKMIELMRKFDIVDIKWVKAHNGNINNERVDTLARDCAYLFSKK